MDQSTSSADSAPDLPTGHDLKGFPEEKAAPPPATPVPNTQKAGLEIPDTPSPYDNISVDSSPIEFLKSFNEKRVPESASTRQELGSQGFPIVEDLLNEEKHLRSIEGASIQGTYVEEGIASNASKKISDPKPHISIDGERASAVFSGTDLEHGLEGTAVNDNSHQRKPALSNGPELHDLNTAAALDIEDEENSAGIQNISSPLQAQIDTPSNSHAQDSTATGEGTSSSLTEANSLHQPENLNDTFSAESPLVNDFLPPVENSLQLAAEIDPEETEQEPLPKAPRGDMVDQRREALPLTTEQKRLVSNPYHTIHYTTLTVFPARTPISPYSCSIQAQGPGT
ncbi:hypothetical protein EJ08DRAFT_384957 [Tothia fuscella]|uniref:Uncharacterized protein n=1 Tax=Tothia fuscella TaxID=1048955 RepID=A0A9P4TW63_9PEZI|nr:hypothetical protein EJ08DRAFT_384957 [Tothia fuscella]